MALAANALYSTTSRGPLPRIQPAQGPGSVKTATFAADTGGVDLVLPVGTPVYVAAATGFVSRVVPNSGTAEIKQVWGFVYPTAVTVKATGGDQVLGTIMIQGSIDYESLLAVRTTLSMAGSETDFKTMLRLSLTRERGLFVEGLDLLGGP